MHNLKKWPLALAISSTLTLTGCLGGGGGGGSDGNTGGGTTTTTRYTLTVGTPTTVTAINLSAQERIAQAIVDFLITPALADTFDDLDPSTFRVITIEADGSLVELGADEFTAEADGAGDGYILELPFSSRINSYIEVPLPSGVSYTTPTTRDDLFANPLTTFVTQQIASRTAQFDELTLEEVDQIIETVLEMANDPAVQAELEQAINSSSSTEQLLEQVGAKLSATIEQQLDDKAAPALDSSAADQASGGYYSESMAVGGYADRGAGIHLGGNRSSAIELDITGEAGTFNVPADSAMEMEIVVGLGAYSSASSQAWIDDEDDSGSFSADARGILFAEDEALEDYEKDSGDVTDCETQTAACTDREYSSAMRFTAAGPANSPLDVMVGSQFYTREVRDDANTPQLQVLNQSLDVMLRRASQMPTVDGKYGVIELLFEAGASDLDIYVYNNLLDIDGAQGSYCEQGRRNLEIYPHTVTYQFNRFTYQACQGDEGWDWDDPNVGESGSFPLSVASDGKLVLDGELEGYASPDGRTLLLSVEGTEVLDGAIEENDGEQHFRQMLLAVKPASTNNLANRQYRLMAIGMYAETGLVEPTRLNAGSLRFDAEGNAEMSAAWHWQQVTESGFTDSSVNEQLNLAFDTDFDEGALQLQAVQDNNDGGQLTFTADGYVQEGERLIVLSASGENSDGGDFSGMMIGVCTNCDE
ncbi:hypothetical protein [Halopseudomonas maritima]|uniref:hypothetical protein n=1 Tax=Halopseudomonas maritima TaxID=2918528 RepID=UPI001EEB6688|nr:hypothetical protein [Halopseudomonas maritima]UJJ30598.1 hypothetical protein HV822_12535 [Halopseudomonas maritima]